MTVRRPFAALLAISLLGTILVAPPALASPREVETGALAWGFKESFRNYVARQIGAIAPVGPAPEGERVTVLDGAAFDPDGSPTFPGSASDPNESLPYLFKVESGGVNDAQNLLVQSRGAVRYWFPSHYFELTISNLALVIEEGSARLVGDVHQLATQDFGQFSKGEFEVLGATLGTVADVEVSIEADVLSVRGSGLTVHADATTALPQAAGEQLDDFALTARLGAVLDDDAPTPSPSPTTSPSPVPPAEPGELAWRVEGAGAVDLGTATAVEDAFLATGTLPAVVVTDSRAGGVPWRVTATASDFSGPGGVVRARHLGWAPALLTAGGGAEAGSPVAPRLVQGGGKGLGVPRTLGLARQGHPGGSATLGATLELRAPLGTPTGKYRAVLTITVVG